MAIQDLFRSDLKVVNIGLSSFNRALNDSRTPHVHVAWRPPLGADREAWAVIEKNKTRIDEANERAMRIILAGRPSLTGIGPAKEAIPGMRDNLFLHAGPPIAWPRMCGPMRGAVVGALIYERRAKSPEEALELAASGTIDFAPCHDYGAVGPMAGIISPSMPVFIIDNEAAETRAFAPMNEGLGKVLRYGAYGNDVIERLRWMENVLFPALRRAIAKVGRIDLRTIIAQALQMGDEVHNRNRAATSLFYRALAPAIARTGEDGEAAARVLEFINGNDHFFLNLSMAACKATLDAARNISGGSIAVVMARNGTDFGVQLSGTGPAWFTGPADVPEALYFPGFSKADANPDIGDSAITETGGLGGFAIAASPAIVQFVGGTAEEALTYTKRMYDITVAEHPAYRIPQLDFRGAPIGIDVRKVMAGGILPFIDTGVAHREPGVGQIGAGVLTAPAEPFIKAFEGLAAGLR